MGNLSRSVIILVLLSLFLPACAWSGEVKESQFTPEGPEIYLPRGQRILELDLNSSENGDYDQAVNHAREIGADSIRLSIFWDEIEVKPGIFQPDPNWLAIANQYYSAQGFSISLVISVLDTTEIRLPADLAGSSFDDPELISRFKALLDYVKAQLPEVQLVSLALGNEIDGVLGENRQAWQEFQYFYDSCAAHARILWPDLPISTKVTYDGLIGPMSKSASAMYANSEVVMTTYYPLKRDFSVRDPEGIDADFQLLVDLFPDKKIHITEIGYPSSASIGSSQSEQARFIQHMFQAWDRYADQIPLISYSWLTDLPDAAVEELKTYYGVEDQRFGEFLRTLGLRTFPGSGENKEGYIVFVIEAKARGW